MHPYEKNEESIEAFLAKARTTDEEMRRITPLVAQARRAYFAEPSDSTKDALHVIEQRAGELLADQRGNTEQLQELVGITDDQLDAFMREQHRMDTVDRRSRNHLTKDKIEPVARVEDVLDASFDKLLTLVGPHVLKSYSELARKPATPAGQPLSLVGGVRPDGEHPVIHRFAQSILVTQDFMENNPAYDHFAGALVVPQMAALSAQLDCIQEIPGGTTRLKSLWRRASPEVDSTIFELLVGAGCAVAGRKPEFLDRAPGKTPDLFCHDPYPLAIECKRKKSLSDYEVHEEQTMRAMFLRLDAAARSAGVYGCFKLVLHVELSDDLANEVVAKLMQQRFAGNALIDYDWGQVSFFESARRIDLPGPTPLYSPNMLLTVFGWNTDLQEFDGLLCRVSNDDELVVDRADQPVGLAWTNLSDRAVKKRSWGPMSVVSEALEQIPTGDFGIVYVAYQDGRRAGIADERLESFSRWLHDMTHKDNIRVPVCKLVRLFPRALGDGHPDLIESTVQYTADYTDDVLPTIYPSRVFTCM